MLLGARQFFEKRGAPPLPYDAEVEYIERDYEIPWLINGSSSIGGFNLQRYFDSSDSLKTTTKALTLEWSFTPNTTNLFQCFAQAGNAFGINGMALNKALSSGYYRFMTTGSYTTSTTGNLDVFHVQKAVPDGAGNWQLFFDGELAFSMTSTTTQTFNRNVLMYGSYASGSSFKMRVKSFKIGSVADLVPVRAGNAVGFYNRVDGELFLEEQECLSAGPDKSANLTGGGA